MGLLGIFNRTKIEDATKEIVKDETPIMVVEKDAKRDPFTAIGLDAIKTYRKMLEQDDRIAGDFARLKNLILSTPWLVKTDSTDQRAIDRADAIQHNLRNLRIDLKETLNCMIDAMVYGYAVGEKVFEVKDGKIWLSYIKPKDQLNISFKTDVYRNLEKVVVGGYFETQEIDPIKMLVCTYPHSNTYNRFYGQSILTPLYEWYRTKADIRKLLNIGIELNIDPPTIAEIRDDVTKEKYTTLKGVINRLKSFKTLITSYSVERTGSSTPSQMPEVTIKKLETTTAQGIWTFVNDYIKDIDRRISKIFNIPEDLTGDNKSGSYARADAQINYTFMITYMTQEWIENLINQQVIPILEDYNFDQNEIAENGRSIFKFEDEERASQEKAEVLKTLKEANTEPTRQWKAAYMGMSIDDLIEKTEAVITALETTTETIDEDSEEDNSG